MKKKHNREEKGGEKLLYPDMKKERGRKNRNNNEHRDKEGQEFDGGHKRKEEEGAKRK